MIEIKEHIDQMKEIQCIILNIVNEENDSNEEFNSLTKFFKDQNFPHNGDEMREFIHLLLIITNNYHRTTNFYNRIEQILTHIEPYLKDNFTYIDLFNLFRENKRLLLFLFEKKIIPINVSIVSDILRVNNENDPQFKYFFYPEIIKFLQKQKREAIENELFQYDTNVFNQFEEKRKLGENESVICQYIRDDSVEKFITYVNKTNLPLKSSIKKSIFETNSFLINKEPTLIEYTAFFGSIKIFQYLITNEVKLTPSLWLYSIHSKNTELIQILEENNIQPEDKTYGKCVEVAIKCHDSDYVNYIIDNLLKVKIDENNITETNFSSNIFAYSFHYHNYEYFPNNFNTQYILFYLCQYDYSTLVNILLKIQQFNIRSTIISQNHFFLNKIISKIKYFEWNFK